MRTISITDLKAHLSRELRRVRGGKRLVVTDRDHAIAEIIPYRDSKELQVIPPNNPVKSFPVDHAIRLAVDPLTFLWEDRSRR